MSEPTARDRETAQVIVTLLPRHGFMESVDTIAHALAAERARVLTLTPEEAGRLFDDACIIAETNRSDDARSWSRAGGVAFLAGLAKRTDES